MGAVNSCWVPRKEFHENHASTPKVKGHRRNLSAAFNLSLLSAETEVASNLLNINTATEEELMTLPGINRLTAQHIVEYRRRIMGFRKVEDLALVSGVGATKLSQIRDEITVSSKKPVGSRGSSIESSNQDLTPGDRDFRRGGNNPPRLVNINTANVFQLMKVKGVGQAVAENIVSHRDKKGPFKSLDDLIKVKRIGPALLGSIRYQLTLTDTEDNSSQSSGVTFTSPVANGDAINRNYLLTYNINGSGDANANCIQPKAEISKDTLNLSASQNDLFDILGPLVARTSRPDVLPFAFKHNGQKALRLAYWNFDRCNLEKANNPGVRDVVCMTVLENGFGIVAVQGLMDREALQRVCDELNRPVLPNLKRWQGHKGSWECFVSPVSVKSVSKFSGYLYDKSQCISLRESCHIEGDQDGCHNPFIAVFQIGEADFVLACAQNDKSDAGSINQSEISNGDCDDQSGQPHVDSSDGTQSSSNVLAKILQKYPDQNDIVFLGNLQTLPKDVDPLRNNGFSPCVTVDSTSDLPTKTSVPNNASQLPEGIWLKTTATKFLTGNKGVVREGLHSPWIPDGWSWGGLASRFSPIWIEVYSGKTKDGSPLFY